MINRLKNSKAGFTLIELMIVVAIVGILSAIAIPNYLSYRTKGQDASARSEARSFYTTSLAYFADTGNNATFSGDAPPPGFGKNPDIAYVTGENFQHTGNGVIVSTMTFTHKASGAQTYSLDENGVITP